MLCVALYVVRTLLLLTYMHAIIYQPIDSTLYYTTYAIHALKISDTLLEMSAQRYDVITYLGHKIHAATPIAFNLVTRDRSVVPTKYQLKGKCTETYQNTQISKIRH